MKLDLGPALLSFLDEAKDFASELEELFIALENDPEDSELVNNVFRIVHTIKGTGGLFGLEKLVSFTHAFESLLMRVRDGEITIDKEYVKVFLLCVDHYENMLSHMDVDGEHFSEEILETSSNLIDALEQLQRPGNPKKALVNELPLDTPTEKNDAETSGDIWHISIRFGKGLLRDGMEPLSFINFLNQLGDICFVEVLTENIPSLDRLEPEDCYLGCEIGLDSNASREEILEVFEFIKDECVLSVLSPKSKVSAVILTLRELPEGASRIGDILVASGAITKDELDLCLNRQSEAVDEEVEHEGEVDHEHHQQPDKIGKILVEENIATEDVVSIALDKQNKLRQDQRKKAQSLRIDSSKLDHLIDLIGELVINGASAQLLADSTGSHDLLESMESMSHLIEEVRESCLRLRMVPIGQTFTRYTRTVRELSDQLGKKIKLVTKGEDTELDKSMVEKISDPLLHLVRNAIDHGIEFPDIRTTREKPEEGTLVLHAFHDSGNVVIDIEDDGNGLDKSAIACKAIEKGLVETIDGMSDEEIYNLIFHPGFSTASEITDLSGRGVGMDVVLKNIESLRGSVNIKSTHGLGTRMRITLPLTLAIIDGFMMGVSDSSYIIPLDSVIECVEVDELADAASVSNYLNMRGEVLPIVNLRNLFGITVGDQVRKNIVIVSHGGRKAGLVVDQLLGEFQTVIKPVSQIFGQLSWMAGSTIIGTGEVAIILDVAGLVNLASQQATDNGRPKDALQPLQQAGN